MPINQPNPFESFYSASGAKHGVDSKILARQGFHESRWKADAKGTLIKKYKGTEDQHAYGAAQFLPSTGRQYGLMTMEDLMNPEKSIDAQAQYMARLQKLFNGNIDAALAAYNWGEGNVLKHIKKHGALVPEKLPKQTRDYLERILGGLDTAAPKAAAEKAAPILNPDNVNLQNFGRSSADQVEMFRGAQYEEQRQDTLGQRRYDEASYGDIVSASFRRTNSFRAWYDNNKAVEGYKEEYMTEADLEWLKDEGIEGSDADFIIENWHGREAAKNQAELLASRHLDNELASRGGAVQSFLLDAATSFADPANLALSLIPGGALLKGAKLFGYANRSRAALIASHAAVGGATNIVGDRILSEQLGMESDPLVNGAVGATLGALGGAFARHTTIPANRERLSGVEAAFERAQLDATANQLEMQGIAADSPVRTAPSETNVFSEKVAELHGLAAKSFGGSLRFDGIGRFMQAPSEKLRQIGAFISPDPTSRITAGRTLEEHAGDVDALRRNAWEAVGQAAEKHHKGISKNPARMMEINDQAVLAVIDQTGVTFKNASPMVQDVALAMRKYWRENADMINNAKLTKEVLLDPNYFYMPVNQSKVRANIKRFGSVEKLKEQLKQWAIKAVDADYIQKKYDEALAKYEAANKDNPNAASFQSPNDFKAKWAEGWANTKMDTGILNFDRAARDNFTTNPDFLEHAARMNRGLEIMGMDGKPFRLTDISTTNFWEASGIYSGTLKGHYGTKMAFGTDAKGVQDMIMEACNELRAKGDTGAAAKYEKLGKDILSNAMGISPHASDSVFFRALKSLRGAQHIKLGGGFGLNAAGEALGAVATMGLRSAFRMFGGLEATIKGAQQGDAKAGETLQFFERVFGYDDMRMNLIDHSGYGSDFYQSNTDLPFASTLDWGEQKIQRGIQHVNRITGFEFFQRRTMEGLRLHLYDQLKAAVNGTADGKFMAHLKEGRIEQYGLTRKDFDAVLRDAKRFMSKNGEIDVKKWERESMESMLDMKTLLGRMANEGIQKHGSNDLPIFFQNPIAQTLFQFMSFPVAAFSRNTLKTVRDRDAIAAFKVLGTSIGAALGYSNRMYLLSLAQDDPQAFRDDKMSMEKIALVGFSRSSFASILPSLINSMVPYDIPGFSDARTTGNSVGIGGGAGLEDINRMIGLGKATMGWMTDSEFEYSEQNKKAAKQLFLPNWLGMAYVYSKVGEALGD